MPDGSTMSLAASPKVARPTCQPFSIDAIVEAVVPLLAPDAGNCALVEGKTSNDLVNALRPLFGTFTVRDAVLHYAALDAALAIQVSGTPSMTWEAIFHAWSILDEFASHANASSAECVAARAHLSRIRHASDDASGDDFCGRSARDMAQWDIRDLRTGRFTGERFCNSDGQPTWLRKSTKRLALWRASAS